MENLSARLSKTANLYPSALIVASVFAPQGEGGTLGRFAGLVVSGADGFKAEQLVQLAALLRANAEMSGLDLKEFDEQVRAAAELLAL